MTLSYEFFFQAPLSDYGRQQLVDAPQKLAAANLPQIDLVAHSPYMRARQTAEQLFREPPYDSIPRLEVPWLHERTFPELFNSKGFDLRVAQLPGWLRTRPEESIAMVGHGRFFQRLLGLETMQPNVGAVETTFNGTALKVVRQLPFAGVEAHPDAFGSVKLG